MAIFICKTGVCICNCKIENNTKGSIEIIPTHCPFAPNLEVTYERCKDGDNNHLLSFIEKIKEILR